MQKKIGPNSNLSMLPYNMARGSEIQVLAEPKPDSDFRFIKVDRYVSELMGDGNRAPPERQPWHWLTMPSVAHIVVVNQRDGTMSLVNTLDPIMGRALPKVPEFYATNQSTPKELVGAAAEKLGSLGWTQESWNSKV